MGVGDHLSPDQQGVQSTGFLFSENPSHLHPLSFPTNFLPVCSLGLGEIWVQAG